MKFGLEIKGGGAAGFPDFKFPSAMWHRVGDLTVADTIRNVQTQTTIDGGSIKRNAPSTLKRKRRLGRGDKSLIDEHHRFLNEASYAVTVLANGVRVSLTGLKRARDIAGFLLLKGYDRWFGLSRRAWQAVVVMMRHEVKLAREKESKKAQAAGVVKKSGWYT